MGYTKTEKEASSDVVVDELPVLMLYNDDVHTFDQVIRALIEICGHSTEQAEQCTMLVHYKGKCDVKRGSRKELNAMLRGLNEQDLTASIE